MAGVCINLVLWFVKQCFAVCTSSVLRNNHEFFFGMLLTGCHSRFSTILDEARWLTRQTCDFCLLYSVVPFYKKLAPHLPI